MSVRPSNGRMRGHSAFGLALSVGVLLASIAFILFVMCGGARAHDAPSGWTYPWSCCSGMDCREMKDGDVKERPEGYVVPSGEVIPMSDPKIKQSPDGRFHWCSVAGLADSRTICLFVPSRAM